MPSSSPKQHGESNEFENKQKAPENCTTQSNKSEQLHLPFSPHSATKQGCLILQLQRRPHVTQNQQELQNYSSSPNSFFYFERISGFSIPYYTNVLKCSNIENKNVKWKQLQKTDLSFPSADQNVNRVNFVHLKLTLLVVFPASITSVSTCRKKKRKNCILILWTAVTTSCSNNMAHNTLQCNTQVNKRKWINTLNTRDYHDCVTWSGNGAELSRLICSCQVWMEYKCLKRISENIGADLSLASHYQAVYTHLCNL